MALDLTKPMMTRGGLKVTCHMQDPETGDIYFRTSGFISEVMIVDAKGKDLDGNREYDLINIPETIERWMNLYLVDGRPHVWVDGSGAARLYSSIDEAKSGVVPNNKEWINWQYCGPHKLTFTPTEQP